MSIGCHLGACLSLPLTAVLCDHGFAGGWPSAFYVIGTISVGWTILWFWFVTSSPVDSRHIRPTELLYITTNNDCTQSSSAIVVPWAAILKSPIVWAVIFVKGAGSFGYMVICTKIPAYLEQVVGVNISHNGLINCLVFAAIACSNVMGAPLSGWFINRRGWRPTLVRKMFQTIGKYHHHKLSYHST